MRTKRLLSSSGLKVFGTDTNYYNRAYWKIIIDGQGRYLFQNSDTKSYLYSEGDKIPGDRGCEGGAAEAPLCVASDANYDKRALWRIVHQGDGKYLIESIANLRYLFSQGEPPVGGEGGWSGSPKCVMSDENYENRALWNIF